MEKKKKRAFDHMLKDIEEAILSRRIKPNEKLPSERELRSLYKIGRGTLREALRALEQKGFIEIKQGAYGGSFVREVGVAHVSELLSSLIRHRQISILHLAEFREVIESSCAAHAAERATQEDIAMLKSLLNKASQYVQDSVEHPDKFYLLEMKMHQELAKISGNPLFEWIANTITESLMSYSVLLPEENSPLEMLDDWSDVIKAMENGEVTKASSIIRSHVVRFSRPMEKMAEQIAFKKRRVKCQ